MCHMLTVDAIVHVYIGVHKQGAGSTFASLPDGEGLKGRREFLHLGLQIWLRGSFCSQTLLRGINL